MVPFYVFYQWTRLATGTIEAFNDILFLSTHSAGSKYLIPSRLSSTTPSLDIMLSSAISSSRIQKYEDTSFEDETFNLGWDGHGLA